MYDIVTRSKNLIPFPYATNTVNADIITTSYDGKITVNGTSSTTAKNLYDITEGLEVGKTYTLSGCPVGGDYGVSYCLYAAIIGADGKNQFKYDEGAGVTFTLPEYQKVRIFLYLKSGYTVNHLVFKPMLNEGNTALPFEPYIQRYKVAHNGERYRIAVKENLIDVDAMLNGCLVKNDDGSYTLTKTSATTRFSGWCEIPLQAGKYFVSIEDIDGTNISIQGAVLVFQFMRGDNNSGATAGIVNATGIPKDIVKKTFTVKQPMVKFRLVLQYTLPIGASVTFKNPQLYRVS